MIVRMTRPAVIIVVVVLLSSSLLHTTYGQLPQVLCGDFLGLIPAGLMGGGGGDDGNGFTIPDPGAFGSDHNDALQAVNEQLEDHVPAEIDDYVDIVKGQAKMMCGSDGQCLDQMDGFATTAVNYALQERDQYLYDGEEGFSVVDEEKGGNRKRRKRRRRLSEILPENELSAETHVVLETILHHVSLYDTYDDGERDVLDALSALEHELFGSIDPHTNDTLMAASPVFDRNLVAGALSVAKESTRYWHAASHAPTHNIRDLGLVDCVFAGGDRMFETSASDSSSSESEHDDDDSESESSTTSSSSSSKDGIFGFLHKDSSSSSSSSSNSRRKFRRLRGKHRQQNNTADYNNIQSKIPQVKTTQLSSRLPPQADTIPNMRAMRVFEHHHYHHKSKSHSSWSYDSSWDKWDDDYSWDEDYDYDYGSSSSRGGSKRDDDDDRRHDDRSRDDDDDDSRDTTSSSSSSSGDGPLVEVLKKVGKFVLRTGFNVGFTVRADVVGLIFGGIVGRGCASSIVSASVMFSGVYAVCYRKKEGELFD